MRIIAISDIHGNSKTFKTLVEERIQLTTSDKLFLLGDYVDRGPDSIGVINYILKLQLAGYNVIPLRGNHENMLLSQLVHRTTTIPAYIIDFIKALPYYVQYENYFFVHAGLNFLLPNPLDDTRSMIWIRNWYNQIDYQWLGNKIIVHGHTPISKEQIAIQFSDAYQQAINIDNGCFLISNAPDYGNLCAVDLTNNQLIFQPNLDISKK